MLARLSLTDSLARLCAEAPDRPLFRAMDGRCLSRRDVQTTVQRMAQTLAKQGVCGGQTVTLIHSDGLDWALNALALEQIGAVMVMVPDFFSPTQMQAVIKDSGALTVIADPNALQRLATAAFPSDNLSLIAALTPTGGGPTSEVIPCPCSSFDPSSSPVSRQIVYSSGTSGVPKGVVHRADDLDMRAWGLAEACGAGPGDRVLSVLPLALLLEQMVAVRATLLVGAEVVFAQQILQQPAAKVPLALCQVAEDTAPTVCVLTPDLLKAWVIGLRMAAADGGPQRAPASLRFLPVGGALVAPALADAAWSLGLPVHEGYGLTEVGSVATVNRPGHRVAGTVGTPLPGIQVSIEDGEVILQGACLMQGYHHQSLGPVQRWATGDEGRLRPDGSLEILGRRDSVMVLASGRNVSPEWVESILLADPCVRWACVVVSPLDGAGDRLASVPAAVIEPASDQATPQMIQQRAEQVCAALPAYARPSPVVVVPVGTFVRLSLLTANGRIRRKAAQRVCASLIIRHHADPLPS